MLYSWCVHDGLLALGAGRGDRYLPGLDGDLWCRFPDGVPDGVGRLGGFPGEDPSGPRRRPGGAGGQDIKVAIPVWVRIFGWQL